jgi:uncharacterized membrane protein
MLQKLARCYPLQLELIPLLLLILAFYIALSNYSLLPDTIPIHFDAQGNPDGWCSKGMIFVGPIASAVIFILLTAFNVILAVADNPKRFINLPKKRKDALTETQAETLAIFINRCLFVLKTLILCLFTYLTWQTTQIALDKASNLGILFKLLIGIILALVGYMVWKSLRLNKMPSDSST